MIESTKQLISRIQKMCNSSVFNSIYDYCSRASFDTERPLRIAISGMIKTGKSTLLNAFLGRNIVPTAVEVMTYNVNWFHHVKYSPKKGVECFVVHYLDGKKQEYPLSEIASFVGYDQDRQEIIDSIHYVDAYVDNPLLERFDLIDTPGLNSILGKDSQHTKDLLTKEENRPDAIIYLISGEFQSQDLDEVFEFNKSTGLLSGINSIAAVTRVDEMENHYETARDIIETNKQRYAEIRYNFSDIYAIAALPAVAAKTLSEEELVALIELSKETNVDTLLATKDNFERSEWNDSNIRKELIEKLSIEGIRLMKDYLLENHGATPDDCRTFLYDFSKVDLLQQAVVYRFSDRADFYKSNIVLSGLKKVSADLMHKNQLAGNNMLILRQIQMLIKDFEMKLYQQYADFYLLKDYYNQETYFDDEDWERIKRLLGEYGKEDYACVNLSTTASKEDVVLAYKNELSYWQNKHRRALVMNNYTCSQHTQQIIQILKNKLHFYKL